MRWTLRLRRLIPIEGFNPDLEARPIDLTEEQARGCREYRADLVAALEAREKIARERVRKVEEENARLRFQVEWLSKQPVLQHSVRVDLLQGGSK